MNQAHSRSNYSPHIPISVRGLSAASLVAALVTVMLASLFLSGCSTTQPLKLAGQTTRQYQERLEISGRIHVQYQKDEKEQSLPGNFEWQQDKDVTEISLLSQLGQTMASIHQDAFGAALQQANQPLRSADNLDSLLSESLGWPLPVAELRHWLQGFQRLPNGQLTALPAQEQLTLNLEGWQVRFISWQQEGDGQIHPKLIHLRRDTSYAGEVSLRIVIYQWKTP